MLSRLGGLRGGYLGRRGLPAASWAIYLKLWSCERFVFPLSRDCAGAGRADMAGARKQSRDRCGRNGDLLKLCAATVDDDGVNCVVELVESPSTCTSPVEAIGTLRQLSVAGGSA